MHARQLTGRGISTIFSSPLGRARTTSAVLADLLQVQVVVVDDLAEVHHGAFAGLTDDEIERAHPGALARRAEDRYHWRFPGGESYADASGRAGRAFRAVAAYGDLRPLLVAHEMINRMLLAQLLGSSPDEALARDHPHDVVYHVVTYPPELRTLSDRTG